jgi:hypothetical protein
LKRWKLELVADLGGRDNVSTQRAAIIDLACKSKFLLDSIDAWLLTRETLIVGRKRAAAIISVDTAPAARGRTRKYLNTLGLERRHKVKSLQEILSQQDDEPDSKPTANGHGAQEPV